MDCLLFFTDGAKELSLWKHFQTLSQQQTATTTTIAEKIKLQLESYLSLLPIAMNENPCLWWAKNRDNFNLLVPVVRCYLGIPASEVASERVFSSAGNVVTERRHRLAQEHVEELVFLHHNL